MRHFPYHVKGFSKKNRSYDFWWRDLSPSADDLKKYHDSKMMIEKVLENLQDRILKDNTASEHLNQIAAMSKRENVTLLCIERDGKPCHRFRLKEIIEEMLNKRKFGETRTL